MIRRNKMMIERKQYRGCIKKTVTEEKWKESLALAGSRAEQCRENGEILTVCLYQYRNMLFVYMETLKADVTAQAVLEPLTPCLELWPEEDGLTPWAPMYHIYHHSIPKEPGEWVRERKSNTKRIGRIAFLYPEKLFSYTYWHYAIVQEGLLKGDKYQCISLHENVLFSYFEEPRHNVSIKETGEESEIISGWLAVDPESHFDREKTQGSNFLIIDAVLVI